MLFVRMDIDGMDEWRKVDGIKKVYVNKFTDVKCKWDNSKKL